MTNEVNYAPIRYGCNGATVNFAFSWKIFELKDLIVQVQDAEGNITDLVLGVDYTAEFDEVGGNVKLNTAYPVDYIVIISRDVSDYQSKDFSTSSGFQASEIEKSLDRVSCNLQEMNYNIGNFKEIFSNQVGGEIDELENIIEENKQEVLLIQKRFEDDINEQIVELKADVDTKVKDVADAADKINALDESIAKCENAAESAQQNAQDCQEILEEVNSIDFDALANVDLSNLSEIGQKKLNSGGGLPLGYIGQTTIPIDESLGLQRYANGSQMTIDKNTEPFVALIEKWAKLYPNMVTSTQEEWETIKTSSHFGQCGKYFINREQGYIQLPLVVNTQGLTDLSNFSNIVEAELPNITSSDNSFYGTRTSSANKENDAFYYTAKSTGTGYSGATQNNANLSTLSFDASRSNSIYKNGATVQQEQIQYPYFIQVATGVEESIDTTRATEINNPFFFGQNEYFEAEPNNPSWLKSYGQYNAKEVYPDYYDWLLAEYNKPTSVKLPNFTTYGIVSVANNIASNFANDSYIKSNNYISLGQNFEIVCKFRTPSDVQAFAPIYSGEGNQHIAVQVDYETAMMPIMNYYIGDGSSWIQGETKSGKTEILANTVYYSKLTFDGSTYRAYLSTNNTEWIEDWSFASTKTIPQFYLTLGVTRDKAFATTYSIDLSETAIKQNGNYIWRAYDGLVKLATETYIDYNFVINQSDETFRLPLTTYKSDVNVAQLDLYYYVGEGVVNPQLVNVARIEEVKANKTDVDGQWVKYGQAVIGNTSLNATTNLKVDLSNILPNDGYRYECIFDMYVSTNSTSGNMAEGALKSDEEFSLTLCRTVTRTSSGSVTSGNCILPIGLGRYVEVYRNANWNGQTNLDLMAYRRIGKNV